MTAVRGIGARVCRRWVRFYTRRLPVDLAADRRAEIDSDLWDHAQDCGAESRSPVHRELEVIARVLLGMPADVTWRRHVLRSHEQTTKGGAIMQRIMDLADRQNWTSVLALLGAAFLVVVGIALIITGTDDNTVEGRIYGSVGLVGGLALFAGVYGLRTGRLAPTLARSLVVGGALVLGVGFWWFMFLPAVIAVVVLYFGVIRRGLESAA